MDFNVTELEENQRFDRFLRKLLKENTDIKLWEIYKMIRKWIIKVNNKKRKDNYRLNKDDIVNLPDNIIKKDTKDNKISKFPLDKIKDMILFEDDNYIFFNKPSWVTIHEWNKHMKDLTMNSFLEKYVKETWINTSSTFSPAFCFRLDKDTSGILIAWKNYDSLKYLNNLIKEHKTKKIYLAVVSWNGKDMEIELPLEKIYDKKFWKAKVIVSNNWQYAKTFIKALETTEDKKLWNISLVQAQLLTWRMHQIRVHLSEKKLPIIWDLMYAEPIINRLAKKYYQITRQLLHSWKYSFEYKWKIYNVKASIPEDFTKLFK